MTQPEIETHRETDWGIPLPGDLLPRNAWSDTHLPRLPLGTLDAHKLFGRDAPLVVDLGCGNGRFTILSAMARPELNHLAIDVFPGAIRYAVKRANRRGLQNVRFAVADAGDIVKRLLPDQSVSELHLLHPQPIYDLADAPKRLLTPSFLVHVHRVLQPSGCLQLQTDHPAYWSYLQSILPLFFMPSTAAPTWPAPPSGITRREILARQLGLTIHRGVYQPLPHIDCHLAKAQAEQLRLPRFDADRKLKQADEHDHSQPLED